MTRQLLDNAIRVAEQAHAGQLYGDQPYMAHVRAVWARICRTSRDPLDEVVAVLHDTVEDSAGAVTIAAIRAEFGADVAEAVDALTKRKDEPYMDYIRRVGANLRARRVKLADLAENRADLIHAGPSHPKRKNLPKYTHAMSYLAVTIDLDEEELVYA
jgi:(p)ppGpp synthase/HD superfamily hydrolase